MQNVSEDVPADYCSNPRLAEDYDDVPSISPYPLTRKPQDNRLGAVDAADDAAFAVPKKVLPQAVVRIANGAGSAPHLLAQESRRQTRPGERVSRPAVPSGLATGSPRLPRPRRKFLGALGGAGRPWAKSNHRALRTTKPIMLGARNVRG